MSEHFNGEIFDLTKQEKEELEIADLERFADFLDGDLDEFQYVFWKLYSFNDLPVELISNIYEEILEKKKGVVYTPPYLVNFLLDEVLPISGDKIDFKVLDPACGSGVFLVGVYRRLIYRWRKNNHWARPNKSVLKKILRENIFGVDIERDAVNLTVFSLSLALCDELKPLEIWEELEFDNLREKNLFHADFFDLLLKDTIDNDFDLVVGNPPFESFSSSEAAEKIEQRRKKERIINSNGTKEKVNIPYKQFSLLFLDQSFRLCKKGGIICMIQPSGPFLYNNSSHNFRTYLLESYEIPQIIDFTHIGRILFKSGKGKSSGADHPSVAVFAKNSTSNNQGLLHVTVRRTKPHKEKLFFDLDSHDFHYVPYELALNDKYIWKSNYLGGGRIHQLVQKLDQFQSLRDFVESKEKNGWVYSAGFRVASSNDINKLEKLEKSKDKLSDTEEALINEIKAKYKRSNRVTSNKYLPTRGLTADGINEEKVQKNKFKYFKSLKNTTVYEPPHILIREGLEKASLCIGYSDDYLSFKEKIVGIHAPESDKRHLKKIYQYLKSEKAVPFYIAAISAEYMIRRATAIKKADVDKIPLIDNDFELSEIDRILIEDFFNYLIDYRAHGETSKIATEDASHNDIESFASIFCEVLNSVYDDLKPYSYYESKSFICLPFYFGKEPNINLESDYNIDEYFEQLVRSEIGVNLRLNRVVKFFDHNMIYLIKPKKLRYWLKSKAIRDADETFSKLRKEGH